MSSKLKISTLTLYQMFDPRNQHPKTIELLIGKNFIRIGDGKEYDCVAEGPFVAKITKRQSWILYSMYKVYKEQDIDMEFVDGAVRVSNLNVR